MKNYILSLLVLLCQPALFGNPLESEISKQAAQAALLKQVVMLKTASPVELIELSADAIQAPRDLGPFKLLQTQNSFLIAHEGRLSVVQNHNIDKDIRGISTDDLKTFVTKDNGYIKVNRTSNGDFTLASQMRLPGGGIGGAWAGSWAGRFIVIGVWEAGIGLASFGAFVGTTCIAGPVAGGIAAKSTFTGLNMILAPAITATSQVGSLAGGILGGTATGPA